MLFVLIINATSALKVCWTGMIKKTFSKNRVRIPVKVATPSERSDAGGLFLLYLVSCRQICLLFSE